VIARISAIVRADFLIRFRRVSTLIVFLLLSAFAYVWVPDPHTGRALMKIGGSRVIYNSAAIGLGTGMLASLFIGLAGFYVISNAVKRDIDTRCGTVIAATNVSSVEYLAGKFLGNVLFLLTFIGGFMVASMGMQAVRGEAAVEPLVMVWQYGLIVGGTILFVAVMALVFECIPWLSGRMGDVFYFFLWASSFGVVASHMEHGSTSWRYFDFTSVGFTIDAMNRALHSNAISVGSSDFDATKPLLTIGRLQVLEVLPRITSTFGPILLLPLALLFFHRFDPARTRAAASHAKGTWLGRLNSITKPLARALFALAPPGATSADALVTFTVMPVASLALVVSIFLGLVSRESLPIVIAIAGVFVADISCRERRSGTLALTYAAPHLRERFVFWKLRSSVIVASLYMSGALVHAATTTPSRLIALVVATLFIAAGATALGIISANPKTFIVLFLSFWYLAVNDKGRTPVLDFAGFFIAPPASVVALYGGLTILFALSALVMHEYRLREA
jgi:hypothetical protein